MEQTCSACADIRMPSRLVFLLLVPATQLVCVLMHCLEWAKNACRDAVTSFRSIQLHASSVMNSPCLSHFVSLAAHTDYEWIWDDLTTFFSPLLSHCQLYWLLLLSLLGATMWHIYHACSRNHSHHIHSHVSHFTQGRKRTLLSERSRRCCL